MRTSYAFDEEMGEGITIDEKEKDSSQTGCAAENSTSASKVGAARAAIDCIAAYLQEIKALPLLSQQEEGALCKEILEYEQYKQALTKQWMILAARAVNRKSLLQAPAGTRRIGQLCARVFALYKEVRCFERSIKRRVTRDGKGMELWQKRAELLEQMRRIVSRFNLLKIKNREVPNALLSLIPSRPPQRGDEDEHHDDR